MNIAIQSFSKAVARSLQTIIEQAGMTLSPDADLRIIHTADILQLAHIGGTIELACPIAPRALITAIAQCSSDQNTATHTLNGGWQFDPAQRCLTHGGESHTITEKESLLLHALITAAPESCTRETLLKQIWAYDAHIETHTLETHIYRLRQKLDSLTPRPCDIATSDGAYKLVMLS